jgi:hypothetical protein
MFDTRVFFLAAAALGLTAPQADALTPLAQEFGVDLSTIEGGPDYAMLSPLAFVRPSEASFEPHARITNRRARLQCVPFARRESGVELRGDASTWWEQASALYERTDAPEEKAVMVLRGYADPNRGHVAVVSAILSQRLVIVDHANWMNAGEISRDVPIRDVSEAGDWSQVQVWNLQTRQWGGRTYSVQGFILNQRRDAAALATG